MIWAFAMNRDFYFEVQDNDEIKWNSAKDVRKGDIILIYTGKPYSGIGFIFKAISDPFEDEDIRKKWNRPAVMVSKRMEIPEEKTIRFKEMSQNTILKEWSGIKMKFMGSHFKLSDEQWTELKSLILAKNPNLKEEMEILEREDEIEEYEGSGSIDFYDLNAGRAHIVRDICYLISNNPNITENDLFNLLRKKVGSNDLYWRAYFQRSHKNNSPGYNLNSARTLGLVHRNQLKLTELGEKLVENITDNELYNFKYGLGTKKFFYELALKNPSIKKAMEILKKNGRLRFYAPTCNLTNKVAWDYEIKDGKYYCKETEHSSCNNCDRDFADHIKESSLPFETLKETDGEGYGFVFWMCSRVTPMYLTGSEPQYSGNYIYWDEEAEKELGDIIVSERIWKLTPGDTNERPYLWPKFKDNGFIGIGWIGNKQKLQKDYREFHSQDELRKTLINTYSYSENTSAPQMIWNFTHKLKKGDLIVANGGRKSILGIGKVTSDYIPPQDPENPLFDDEYTHLRKVDWIITDEFEIDKENFFDIKTLTPLDGKKWNEIITAYARLNPEFKQELLKTIYNEFKNNYLNTQAGQDHLKAYKEESEKITDIYSSIQEDKDNGIDATDKILYGLVPHRYKSIVGFVVDIKAFLEKNLEIKPEKFPEIANNLFDTLHDLVENDENPQLQSEIIDKFVDSEFSKGFGAGTVTPTLFFIDQNYPFINNKTVDTVTFMSKIMGVPVKIDRELKHYIDNKSKLEDFISELSTYIPGISDFYIFDIFCHWMCDKNLAYYAKDNPLPLIGEPPEGPKPKEPEPVFLNPSEIETHLILHPKILEQICGTLNSGKHIMLTGAPGTGKTNLALDVCKVAVNHKFTNGYVLTTATSDWTTFDTIGGYMPNEKSQLIFNEGKFLQAIKEDKWLIIDEINRSDIDKAFGQLFTVLSGQEVELPFKVDGKSVKIEPTDEYRSYYDSTNATYYVGKNWRILATMNVYDKDYLFEMSYAFMRRFTFIYIDLPVEEEYKILIEGWCDGLDEEYVLNIHELLKINPHREIGPAIFKDVVEYVSARKEIGSTNHILEDAFLSYIMPQFEGLEKTQILEIWKILKSTFTDSDELKHRLEEISTIKLDDVK